ncbi:glutathione peroxidase [Legionella impletisoli]|uniref:Glutathione peroxidase n=1 Tax=Legionella impletisoli TaxID=343510 RepID=A0A917JUP3_9GAMM|nr:glutathione peroxidase [Legionella impletisoli]GGI87653.1 glutathione peroxidase [Legionella impletisoli]
MSDALYNIPLTTINGESTTLAPYKGQILLIVNVASRCGFTKQYAELEQLYQDYKDQGFTVLGFPSNQFLYQEPGSEAEIKHFAEQCFRVTFPLFAKIQVRGPQQSALYAYLSKHIEKKRWPFIPWNFTKILVDQQGRILKRFPPTTALAKIRREIEQLLQTR